jgi:hypothetical protein
VDIGAYHGLWSKALLDIYGELVRRIYLVEPLAGNNAVIDRRLAQGFFDGFQGKIVGKSAIIRLRWRTLQRMLHSVPPRRIDLKYEPAK